MGVIKFLINNLKPENNTFDLNLSTPPDKSILNSFKILKS